jgi:hypothetical protein
MPSFADVKIKGLERVIKNIAKYPQYSKPIYAKAINAGLAEVQKVANEGDSGNSGIFEFKTPRVKRTGWLASSFGIGLSPATPDRLIGSVGPTAFYAIIVHEGLKGRDQNPFMVRIVQESEPKINKHFEKATEMVVDRIAQ